MTDPTHPSASGPPGGNLSREALDRELSPSLAAKDFAGTLDRWAAGSAGARSLPGARLDLGYAEAPRARIDLFVPDDVSGPVPLVAFIHGGFWQEGAKETASFPAPAALARGIAFAAIGYTLAPDARLTDIVAEIAVAYRFLAANAAGHGIDPGRIAVAGHSAGAHLAAMLLTRVVAADAPTPAMLALASGVFALGSIRRSYVNDVVGMTPEEARFLSPALHRPVADIPVALFVGAEEPGEFHRQSAALAAAWGPLLSKLDHMTLPGRDHFDILDALAAPDGAILAAIAAALAEGAEIP